MDFQISKDQKQFVQEVIKFAKEHLNDTDHIDEFSYEMWKKAADFGLFGINVDEAYDGMGEGYLTAALVTEALGFACENNGFVFAVNNHIWVAISLIAQFGSKYLKDKYLPSMVQGRQIGAMAITEPDSGSDANSMIAKGTETGDGYILNGNKMFISNGTIADVFVVFAKTDRGMSAFVAEKSFKGVRVGKDIDKMGLKSCPMAEVVFDNCFIPESHILGAVGKGKNIMSTALELERCYEFACHVGAMQRIMNRCIIYANQRKQFDKAIAEYQSVSHKIANIKVSIEMAKLMLYKIAWLKDNNKSAYLESSIFKLYVSESYIRACQDAMQIFGAYGYTTEYGIERELRDAMACSIYSGTNEMQRNTIYALSILDVV